MPLLETLNPAQKQAITHTAGPLLIIAGAGTGKTTVVTQRIAWLITEQKVKPDHILALTFTDKAAGEMEERVDKLLPMGYVDLWVSTFHSFCERVLRDHALDIGLSPDFTLLDETDQAILMRENLEKFELNYYRPLGNPTKFVTSLISHFSRCKDEAIRPEEYLQFAEKLKLDLDEVHGRPAIRMKAKGGRDVAPRKVGSDDKDEHVELRKKKSEDDAAEIVEAERIAEVANAYHTYQQLLFAKSCLDFGDLITQTLYLFQQRPKILERYQQQFQYVLVDEFQDTNWAQYELVKMLAAPRNNLTVVGDDDQSIYKFRGASVANILAFKKDYPKAKEVVLTENYRSTQNILDLAYGFIQHNNPNRLEVQLGNAPPLTPPSQGGDSEGKKKGRKKKSTPSNGISKKLVAQTEEVGEIGVWQMPTLEQEASAVVEKIITLKKKQAESSYNDFAILVRANDHATPFLQRLKAANVPFQFLASAGLYRQPIILDILNYLKLLDNYHETASLYRILTLPLLAIPLPDVMHLLTVAKRETKSLYDITKQVRALTSLQPATIASVEILHGWLEAHSQLARTQPVGEVTLKFLEDSGMLQQITGTTDAEHLEQVGFVNQLFQVFQSFQSRHAEPTVANFLHELAFAQDAGDAGTLKPPEWEQGPEAVKVMTVHGAKGLEFPYVFLVNLVDKRFPTIERREPIAIPDPLVREKVPEGDWHVQEERRLFYVGITRAKRGVFFLMGEDYGGSRKKKPSRFIAELGVQIVPKQVKGTLTEAPTQAPGRVDDDHALLRQAIPAAFSFTQIKAFENCPKQYKYAHLLKIPVPGHASLSFGQTIHNTLLNFFKLSRERSITGQADLFGTKPAVASDKPAVSWAELQELYKAAWIDQWYANVKQKQEYKQRGVQFLKNFYDNLPTPWPQPVELEKGFTISIGGHKLRGKIDRIDPAQGGIAILDYKTSEKPPADPAKADLEQLHLYAIAAREALGQNPVSLSYIYLATDKPYTYPIDDTAIAKTKAKVEGTIAAILASDFKATPAKHICDHCDFRNICENRWRG